MDDPGHHTPDPCDPELDTRYHRAVGTWLSLEDPRRIAAVYDAEVFPLALARLERDGAGRPPAELLLLPVGTQPYSPRLVAAGMPARAVGLLATPESLEIAASLGERLRKDGTKVDQRVSESGGVSRQEVAELALRMYRTAGEPDPARVVVDLTSGRKPTVAALASVADALGATSCYLEARFHRHPHGGYATGERLVLSGPLALAAVTPALEAPRALARAGLFREALRHLDRQGRERYLPPAVRAARQLLGMCDRLLAQDGPGAARALGRARREAPVGSSLHRALETAWELWGRFLAAGSTGALAAGLQELRRVLPATVRPSTLPLSGPAGARHALGPVLAWLLRGKELP